MATPEQLMKCGEIALSALGSMKRQIVMARKATGKEKWSANQILDNIVMPILVDYQEDVRAVMDGKKQQVAEEVTITSAIEHADAGGDKAADHEP